MEETAQEEGNSGEGVQSCVYPFARWGSAIPVTYQGIMQVPYMQLAKGNAHDEVKRSKNMQSFIHSSASLG